MKCEGECKVNGNCKGTIKKVKVVDKYHDWGYFYYCDTAIETNRAKGLMINIIEEQIEE